MMTPASVADMLANATCAILDDNDRPAGTAWLFSWDGHLLTAGHLIETGVRTVQVRFIDDSARTANVIFRALNDEIGIDFAVLKVELPGARSPLILSLTETPTGRFSTYGYGATLAYGSSAAGEFVGVWDRQDSKHARLFKLQSEQLEPGFSGGAIFSEALQAVVGLQTSATDKDTGQEASTALAMPLYRIANIWGDLASTARSRITADLAFLPVIDHFYGRTAELDQVRELICSDNQGIVAIVGLAGIGKTTLAAKLVAMFVSEEDAYGQNGRRSFDYICWKSLRSAPTFVDFAHEAIALLTGYTQSAHLSESDAVSLIVRLLQQRPTLIVLDNFDSLLARESAGSEFRPGYEAYGDLLRALSTVSSRSTVCLTTRELPADIVAPAILNRRATTVRLSGLDWRSGKSVCNVQAPLEGSALEWEELCSRYSGNPLALQLVSLHVTEVFDSSLSDFLNTQSVVLPDVRVLLDWHLARLTEFEKELLYWLAINQIPSTLDQLRADLLTTASKKALPSTVQRLRQRTVIEQADGGFFLQPVLIEYLNEKIVDEIEGGLTLVGGPLREELLSRLTDAVETDIRESNFTILNRHALLKATARSDVREIQRRFLIEPLLRRLEDVMGTRQAVKDHCARLLIALKSAVIQDGYATSNILNLLCVGRYDLTGLDFSGLPIRQAALDSVVLREVNFTECRFSHTTFRSSFGSVLSVAWSPSDSLLAAGTASCEVLIWNVETRQLKWSLTGHTDWVRAVLFLSERELVTAGDDGTIRLWNLADDEGPTVVRIMNPERGWIRALAGDPRGRLLASSCQNGSVLLWDLDRGTLVTEVAQHEGPCLGVHIEPETRELVSVGVDGLIAIRTLADEAPADANESPPRSWAQDVTCYCVSASPGLDTVVIGMTDGDVALWTPDTDQRRTVALNLLRPVRAVTASRDGQSFWVTCSDSVARSVATEDGTIGQALLGHTAAINTVAQSTSGNLVATGADDQTVRLWNARTGKSLAVFSGFSGSIRSLASISQGVIVTLGEDRELRYWECDTGKEIYSARSEGSLSWPVAVEPSAAVVACASTDGTLRIFDQNARKLEALPAHRGPLRAVGFSPSGALAATGGADHIVRVWDARAWTQLAILQKHTDWVRAVAFLDDDVLASASDDGSVLIWSVNDRTCVGLPRTPRDLVHCLVSVDARDDQWLVCGSEGGHVEIWDLRTLTKVLSWRIPGSVRALAVSSQRDRIMAGGFGGEIHVWNLHTGEAVARYVEHTGWVRALVFMDENGSTVASCGSDGCARLWDVDSGVTRQILRPQRPYEGMTIVRAAGLDVGTIEKLQTLGAKAGEL